MVDCEGDTVEPLRAQGTFIDISYNAAGLWNDTETELGFQMRTSEWAPFIDASYPGGPIDWMGLEYDRHSTPLGIPVVPPV